MLRKNLAKLGKTRDSNFSRRSMENLVPTFFLVVGLEIHLLKKRNSQSYLSCTVKRKRVKTEAEVLQGLLEMTGNSRQWNIYS